MLSSARSGSAPIGPLHLENLRQYRIGLESER
jgi:hypothetical protein